MVERKYLLSFLLIMLLWTLWLPAAAQGNAAASDIKHLEAQMHKLYSQNDKAAFMDVTDRLKAAALKAGDERMFYRTWSNQATYLFRSDRERGAQITREMTDYAKEHDSKYGLYISSYTNANHMSSLKMEAQAEELYLEAISFKERYLPDVNAAACYTGLGKIYINRRQREKIREMADKALKQPNPVGAHVVTAWAHLCYAALIEPLDTPAFFRAYDGMDKAREKYHYRGNLDQIVDMYHAQVCGDYQRMLELAQQLKIPIDRLSHTAHALTRLDRWQEAYNTYVQYKKYSDSINSDQARRQSAEHALALDAARAENEAKDLKLRNQALLLEQTANELEQQRLEEEALNLSLKNRDIELQNAAVRLQNDSLDRHNKEIQLREYETKMRAEKSAERARTLITALLGVLAALTIAYLVFYLNSRRKRLRQLQEAYDRLEETTSAKERIESELRIARDIQLSMVPSTFPAYPDRRDIDLYAQMVPAKAVGGDLYDFFLQGERLYFCVGDVSGKGVPASMTMSVAVQLFRTVAKEGFPPAYVATKLNDTLSADNESGMFVTMFIGVIDLQTGRMDFCNAGHNPPVIIDRPLSPGQPYRVHFMEMETNAPIGLWPELEFVGEHLENVKGRQLFLYTDGVNEAENTAQEQYGDDRLLRILSEATPPLGENTPKSRSRYIVESVRRSVQAFTAGAEQSDDLTMLCLSLFTNIL